jgi:hypothetical protein
MKTVINVIISRLDSDKEGSTELEDTIETSQSEEQREKNPENKKE